MSVTTTINGKEVTFELVLGYNKRPVLQATHINGVETWCGFLLRITEDGRIGREPGVSNAFGFKLNSEFQIKVVKKGLA